MRMPAMAPKGLLDRDTSAEAAEEDIDKLGAGRLIPLSEVDDKIFASASMGSGIAVEPVTGKIIAVPKSGHAYGIKTDDAVEILVHVGIDTVQMRARALNHAWPAATGSPQVRSSAPRT